MSNDIDIMDYYIKHGKFPSDVVEQTSTDSTIKADPKQPKSVEYLHPADLRAKCAFAQQLSGITLQACTIDISTTFNKKSSEWLLREYKGYILSLEFAKERKGAKHPIAEDVFFNLLSEFMQLTYKNLEEETKAFNGRNSFNDRYLVWCRLHSPNTATVRVDNSDKLIGWCCERKLFDGSNNPKICKSLAEKGLLKLKIFDVEYTTEYKVLGKKANTSVIVKEKPKDAEKVFAERRVYEGQFKTYIEFVYALFFKRIENKTHPQFPTWEQVDGFYNLHAKGTNNGFNTCEITRQNLWSPTELKVGNNSRWILMPNKNTRAYNSMMFWIKAYGYEEFRELLTRDITERQTVTFRPPKKVSL